jgi:6-phosphogluconolactonase
LKEQPTSTWSRRGFQFVLSGLVLGAFLSPARAADCTHDGLVYVGTDGNPLRALRFDACVGKLAAIGKVAEVPKSRWIVAHPSLPVLYVTREGADKEGSVVVFGIDRRSGALNALNESSSGGSGPTHLWLDASSKTLLVANFGAGSTSSLAIERDGRLSPPVSTLKATGSGPHRRQASPHAHGVAVDPSGRQALVADMGADRIFVYDFDRSTHALSAGDATRSFAAAAGSGPRRAVFGASGRFVHVLNELSAELMTLRWDAGDARLTPVQTLSLSSSDFKGTRSASEIAVSRDGRFVYAADRGENTLVVFRVNAETGELALLQRLPSGGEAPWAFEIHRSGKWLLVANYRSNRLNLFGIDIDSGRLTDTGQSVESTAPVSAAFVD